MIKRGSMNKICIIFFILLNLVEFSFANENKTEILIVYYSRTGNTKILAEAVARGAKEIEGTIVKISSVDSASIKDVQSADAIIIGSPVYNANVVPKIQEFINRWPFKNSPLKNKVGAAFVTAGGISAGEEIVLTNILKSMLIFGMIIVGGDDWQSAFGASAIVSEKPFSKNINQHFIQKAENLGKRVAEIAVRLNN
jgi:NAD(P)H dehydrogenase (quinone)